MAQRHPANRGRWRMRTGLMMLGSGAVLILVFAVSARWWFGYSSPAWVADLGDGTLYLKRTESNDWSRPLLGWAAGDNTFYTPAGGRRSWTWTWWTWGKPALAWQGGSAYTVWPIAPVMAFAGAWLWWPSHRAHKRVRNNQCVRCGYSRDGLPAGSPCPECGERSEADAAT